MAEQRRGRKSSSYEAHPTSPAVKAVLTRWWWVLMPLLGVVCAQAYVTPHLTDSGNAVTGVLKYRNDRLDELGAEYTTVENELVSVETVIDTLYQPNYEWHTVTRDSLRTVRRGIEEQFPLVETQIGTLKGQLKDLEQPLQATQAEKERLEREIESHRGNLETLRDSLSVLVQEQEALADRLYRLQHPEEFDRSRALISPGR